MEAKPRSPLPPEAFTLPAKYYIDADLHRAELERFYYGRWVCAGRADRIPRPGDYFLREFNGESVIIVRDLEHTVQAFFNVCRHRGTRLCTAAEGNLHGRIQCPYHAWTYDLGGRLVGAPHMEGTPRFRMEDYPLHKVHTALWDGHIFMHLGENPPPLADQLAGLPEKFRPWRMEELRFGASIVYDVKANWKLIVQNYSECLHCPVIHPAFQKLSHYLSGENYPAHSSYLGGRNELREGVETVTLDGKRSRDYLPGLAPEDRHHVYFYAILPNLLLSLHPDYMMTHTLWPRSVDQTQILCEWSFHQDEFAKPGFNPNDAVEFWDMTNRQDWEVSELLQLGLQSRAYTPGPYSNREDLLYEFDQLIKGTED